MPRAPKPVISDKGINFGQLGAVVGSQLDADAKYDREDAAKFRAVAQKVPTYEDFENIVIGSHLKPMKEDVTDLTLKRSAWDTTGRGKTRARRRDKTAGMSDANKGGKPTAAPTSLQNWRRDWKSNCKSEKDKYDYLLLCGAEVVEKLFTVEIPDGQLGPIFVALNVGYTGSGADTGSVQAIVDALPRTGRYDLAVDFMMDDEEAAYKSLMAKLAGSPGTPQHDAPTSAEGAAAAAETADVDDAEMEPGGAAVSLLAGGALEAASKKASEASPAAAAGSPRRMQIAEVDSDDESDDGNEDLPPLEEVDLNKGAVSPLPE